ncbi:MAG: DUF1924 domain-containing protein [Gammaproteobacteria bacterium]|nr:DUF1924 domain-containing protein [Gammaproteobacteria bacterium]
MKRTALSMLLLGAVGIAHAGAVDDLLGRYADTGAGPFDARRGAAFWQAPRPGSDGGSRRCADCHGNDLTQTGHHVRTRKPIEPLAPSANPMRLTDTAKIEKWFRRNCDWTVGRVCTAQEKGDLLAYLRTL